MEVSPGSALKQLKQSVVTINPARVCVSPCTYVLCEPEPSLEHLGKAAAYTLLLAPIQSDEDHVVFAGLRPQQQAINLMSFVNSQLLETPASAGKLALSRGLGCGRRASCTPKLKPCNPTTTETHIYRKTQEGGRWQ